jgi:hypothetical protein
MVNFFNIIHQLYPNVVDTSTKDGINYLCLDKDGKEITIDTTAVETELAKQEYKNKRRYPSIQDQLDMQYWDKKNGTTTWVDAVAKVKSDNPKP